MANIGATTPPTGTSSPPDNGKAYRGPFAIMTVLFFMWGFITSINDILIPQFKDAFNLDYRQAMLVQFAFFGAYFIGSILYFLISATKGDPIARIGYKNGVVIGLLFAAFGTALVWLGATVHIYALILGALFIIGLGFAMLQIAANPYVTILGPERTASSRLNLAQAFNSVGTTTGPLIGGYLIFKYFAQAGVNQAESVKIPYLGFCLFFLIIAAIFFSIHLPHVGEGKVESGIGALKYPHVVLGVIAIFMYVGGEVSIGSSLINFLGEPRIAGLTHLEASKYVALFWGGMLVGRFMGAVELSDMKKGNKRVGLAGIPILAFLLFWVLRSWNGDQRQFDFSAGWTIVENYLPLLALCWLFFQFGKGLADRTLFVFSATIVVLLAIAILFGGKLAMWCAVGVGLFTSIGWPNIFSLALDRMGVYKSQVSSLLVMAVVGGAFLPLLQGSIADFINDAYKQAGVGGTVPSFVQSLGNRSGLQIGFVVPLIAYAYVAFYGIKGYKIGRPRG
jgi:FHS family L-fucose permease-like MFS transporter